MCDLQQWISQYLLDCQYQKGLDPKTIKAYRIDLAQFLELAGQKNFKFTRNEIMAYISRLHQQYKPKTIRRKIASIKAFFGYLEYEGLVQENPFSKLRIKLAIPVILPRTIPLSVISSILASAYQQKETARSQIQRDGTLRDIAVLELLFATGVRVSELCTLGYDDVRLEEGEIKIYGKGAKERFVQIANPNAAKGLTSKPIDFIPLAFATATVVPAPQNGSQTTEDLFSLYSLKIFSTRIGENPSL